MPLAAVLVSGKRGGMALLPGAARIISPVVFHSFLPSGHVPVTAGERVSREI